MKGFNTFFTLKTKCLLNWRRLSWLVWIVLFSRPWSTFEKSSQCFAAICMLHLQCPSDTLQHCGREEGGGEVTQTPTLPSPSSLKSVCTTSSSLGYCCSCCQCCWGSLSNVATTAVFKSVERTTHEVAAHKWWQNVEKIYQK